MEAEIVLLGLVGQHIEKYGWGERSWQGCRWSWRIWSISACVDRQAVDCDFLPPFGEVLSSLWSLCIVAWRITSRRDVLHYCLDIVLISTTTQSSCSWQTLGNLVNSWSLHKAEGTVSFYRRGYLLCRRGGKIILGCKQLLTSWKLYMQDDQAHKTEFYIAKKK